MTTLIEPECSKRNCLHFIGADDKGGKVICKAFPKGIPSEIAYGDNLHTKPFPGDRGITFEQRPDQDG